MATPDIAGVALGMRVYGLPPRLDAPKQAHYGIERTFVAGNRQEMKTGEPSHSAKLGEACRAQFIYREAKISNDRLITAGDLVEVFRLAAFCVMARLIPSRYWGAFSRALVRALRGWRPWPKRKIKLIASALEAREASLSPQEIRTGLAAGRYEQRLQLMRFYPFGQWNPVIRVSGTKYLRHSLERKKGVVLWIVPFHNSGLFAKMGLHRTGVSISHLSRPGHGFSSTRFGIRFLNPIRSRIEDSFLSERLLIVEGNTAKPVETILSRLRDNQVVSITVSSVEGRRLIRVPFLNGLITLATGAPSICQRSGAALLPVFPVKTGPNEFEINIGESLRMTGSKEQSIVLATESLLRQLEPFVLKYPDQWHGWRNLTVTADRGGHEKTAD